MPTYTLQQRIFLYDSYVITSSCREVVRRFQANYPGVRVPSREAVNMIWVCWNIRESPGVSAGLGCTRYRRPSRTVKSLYIFIVDARRRQILVLTFVCTLSCVVSDGVPNIILITQSRRLALCICLVFWFTVCSSSYRYLNHGHWIVSPEV